MCQGLKQDPQVAHWVKISTCNAGDAGDVGSIYGSGRSPEGGHGSPLQYVMPAVQVPTAERTRHPRQCKRKREFITSSSQGPGYIQHSGIRPEPRSLYYSSIYRFRTKTGNWQGWIGYKGFFASTNWLDFRLRGLS